jgi:hypothetical protein
MAPHARPVRRNSPDSSSLSTRPAMLRRKPPSSPSLTSPAAGAKLLLSRSLARGPKGENRIHHQTVAPGNLGRIEPLLRELSALSRSNPRATLEPGESVRMLLCILSVREKRSVVEEPGWGRAS